MVNRFLQTRIEQRLYKGKVILLMGPRQVGKTTLVDQIAQHQGGRILRLDGDEPDMRKLLDMPTSTQLRALTASYRMVIIDEAQRIPNIGITLKLLADKIPDIQVIATGSSSLELADQIQEPLTGRKYEFYLFPFSFGEMAAHSSLLEEKRLLSHRMIYGYYPEVVLKAGEERESLSLLSNSYLYKDLFSWEQYRKPAVLENLLQALALQLGSEVSYGELSQLLGIDRITVERYIDLLEKTFVVFRLSALSRNSRNELKKGRKIYFYDNGIRNAIIKNFNPLELRQDTGALWENYLMSERKKALMYQGTEVNNWFWRTFQQQEVDYVEESDGKMRAYEFKWNTQASLRFPRTFREAYPDSSTEVITPENYSSFLLL